MELLSSSHLPAVPAAVPCRVQRDDHVVVGRHVNVGKRGVVIVRQRRHPIAICNGECCKRLGRAAIARISSKVCAS